MIKSNIIRLINIEKTYNTGIVHVNALRGVSLEINSGEFVAIIGTSGSGKSTLMNIIGFLDTPTSGDYYFENTDTRKVDKQSASIIRRENIGFVFQGYNLLPRINAIKNIGIPLLYQGVGKEERESRAMEMLKQVNLEKRAYHLPVELSGGEQQRIAIARALSNNPKLILADEPTGNLDSKSGTEIMDIFKALHSKGITIIMVTHNNKVADEAQRVIELEDGLIKR